jgi:DNA-binding response OmpR family regulator
MEKFKILIVEDDPFISEVIRINLACPEYAIASAENGRVAIEMFSREIPDLVILDILMPEMDGWQVIEHIRKHPSLSHTKILIESALLITPEILLKKNLSLNTMVLLKPFSLDELRSKVKTLLAKSSANTFAAD